MLGNVGATLGAKIVAVMPAKAPNAGGFYTWLTGAPVRVILAIVAIGVIIGANRGRLTKAVTTSLIVCVGLFIMFGDTAMKGLAKWLGSYFS